MKMDVLIENGKFGQRDVLGNHCFQFIEGDEMANFKIWCKYKNTGELKLFHCHKILLLTQSVYFRSHLLKFDPDDDPTIHLEDIFAETLGPVLEFIYCGKVVVDFCILLDFLVTLKQIEIPDDMSEILVSNQRVDLSQVIDDPSELIVCICNNNLDPEHFKDEDYSMDADENHVKSGSIKSDSIESDSIEKFKCDSVLKVKLDENRLWDNLGKDEENKKMTSAFVRLKKLKIEGHQPKQSEIGSDDKHVKMEKFSAAELLQDSSEDVTANMKETKPENGGKQNQEKNQKVSSSTRKKSASECGQGQNNFQKPGKESAWEMAKENGGTSFSKRRKTHSENGGQSKKEKKEKESSSNQKKSSSEPGEAQNNFHKLQKEKLAAAEAMEESTGEMAKEHGGKVAAKRKVTNTKNGCSSKKEKKEKESSSNLKKSSSEPDEAQNNSHKLQKENLADKESMEESAEEMAKEHGGKVSAKRKVTHTKSGCSSKNKKKEKESSSNLKKSSSEPEEAQNNIHKVQKEKLAAAEAMEEITGEMAKEHGEKVAAKRKVTNTKNGGCLKKEKKEKERSTTQKKLASKPEKVKTNPKILQTDGVAIKRSSIEKLSDSGKSPQPQPQQQQQQKLSALQEGIDNRQESKEETVSTSADKNLKKHNIDLESLPKSPNLKNMKRNIPEAENIPPKNDDDDETAEPAKGLKSLEADLESTLATVSRKISSDKEGSCKSEKPKMNETTKGKCQNSSAMPNAETVGKHVELEKDSNAMKNKKKIPVKIDKCKSSPVKIDECKSSPVKIDKRKSSPVKIDECKSSPVKIDKRKSSPVKIDECKSSPVKIDKGKSSPVKIDECKSSPVKIDKRKSSPVKIDKCKSSPVKIDKCKSSPVKIDKCKSSPVKSEKKPELPKPATGSPSTSPSKNLANESEQVESKSFVCTTCSKAYDNARGLKEHQAVHDGLTTCEICSKVLASVYGLRKHIKNVHNNNSESLENSPE